jgi:aspartyl-tRNA synthetase
VLTPESQGFARPKASRNESVISGQAAVVGRRRGESQIRRCSTGAVEVDVDELDVLVECRSTLPFQVAGTQEHPGGAAARYGILDRGASGFTTTSCLRARVIIQHSPADEASRGS